MDYRVRRFRHLDGNPLVQFSQFEYPYAPGQPPLYTHLGDGHEQWSPHTFYNVHDGVEIGLVLSGRSEVLYAEHKMEVTAADVWLAAMWELHGCHCTEGAPRRVVLTFLPQFLGETEIDGVPWLSFFAVPPQARPRVAGEKMRTRVLSTGKDLYREIEEQAPAWQEVVRLHVSELLHVLKRGWTPPVEAEEPIPQAHDLRRLMPVITTIQTDPAQPLSLARAAAQCRVSRTHLNRLFRRVLGTSFAQFQLRARLRLAADRLSRSEPGVREAAEQAGFSDASHLHRHFVRHFGCTPADYRRRFRP